MTRRAPPPTHKAQKTLRTSTRSTRPRTLARRWKIHLTIESKALRVSTQTIRAITRESLACVSHEIFLNAVREIHVMIINDARMRELNFTFRKKDKPTDVLSFPQYTPGQIRGTTPLREAAGTYLGDLVISSETTRRQAARFGVTVREELVRLIVHGILHLIGYDHEGVPARQAQAMRRRERAVRELVVTGIHM